METLEVNFILHILMKWVAFFCFLFVLIKAWLLFLETSHLISS